MKIEKAVRRDKKITKRKYGMRKDGYSVFLIEDILKKKAEKAKALERKEELEAEASLWNLVLSVDEED